VEEGGEGWETRREMGYVGGGRVSKAKRKGWSFLRGGQHPRKAGWGSQREGGKLPEKGVATGIESKKNTSEDDQGRYR